MGVAKVEYYGRTLIDLTGDSVNPDVLGEGETAHDANGDLIVGRGVLNKGNFANAIVGNVSGEIVAIDDVSPLEHRIPVKVRSKNVIPFPYNDIDKTTYGITFNVNADGSIVLNGTSTNLASFNLYHPNQNIRIPFEAGVIYTIGKTGERASDVSLWVLYADETGQDRWANNSFTWQNNFVLKLIYLQVNSAGKTFDNYTAYPIIAEGTTVPTFAPYIANDEVITVRSCGKNLIPFPYDALPSGTGAKTINGVTFTVQDDSTITTSGTTTSEAYFSLFKRVLSVGNYFLSGMPSSPPSGIILLLQNADKSVYVRDMGNGAAFKVEKESTCDLMIYISSGKAVDGVVFKPQLEIGDVTTEYERYIEGETIITTLAEGAELTSIAPNMTIYTDKVGAIVECSYNKDTNIVIEKLTQAIIALGGNV